MPELPEVETTVRNLRKKVLQRTFVSLWSDSKKMVKKPAKFSDFERTIKGLKIKGVFRRGKNIIFQLSEGYFLLIHQKLTGHLLYGKWEMVGNNWRPLKDKKLAERVNSYIHFVFFLDNGKMIALSDLRKFAKIELAKKEEMEKEMEEMGPDALEISFSNFEERLKKSGLKIKQALMDQKIIAGIGNIYSNEALFMAKINPFRRARDLSEKEIKELYLAIKRVLKLSIKLQGESFSDYRLLSGEKGRFDKMIKVYRRQGEKCPRCGAIIKKSEINNRSVYFCPKCQK